VIDAAPDATAGETTGGLVRWSAERGRAPLGAIFGGIGVVVAGAVSLMHLDRLPITVCLFKGLTGLPCPTCGSTRAVARLFGLDLAGALAMNPIVTAVAVVIAAWALVDLALLPSRRSLRLELSPRLGQLLRATALALFFLNWVYLILAGR
jgi:Protein of unknown function (DUF2752)